MVAFKQVYSIFNIVSCVLRGCWNVNTENRRGTNPQSGHLWFLSPRSMDYVHIAALFVSQRFAVSRKFSLKMSESVELTAFEQVFQSRFYNSCLSGYWSTSNCSSILLRGQNHCCRCQIKLAMRWICASHQDFGNVNIISLWRMLWRISTSFNTDGTASSGCHGGWKFSFSE